MMSSSFQIPTILSIKEEKKSKGEFPVAHYSYSSFTKFSTDPFMFKVRYINGDSIDTTTSPSAILGQACHKALQTYLGGNPDMPTPADEGEAITLGHDVGLKFLQDYPEGFIAYNTVIGNREKLMERYAFAYFGYIKESHFREQIKELLIVEKALKHKVSVDGKILPIPLKGFPDLVYRDEDGRIVIEDHKFTSRYSPEEDIDGEKLIQSIFLFYLVTAELGELPHRIKFREFKVIPNADKSPQTKEFEIVYQDTPLAFDFFFRFYEDVTDALMGKAVFVPNIKAMYDKEVSILAYIHRLDIDEERAKRFKEAQVDNITDFLKMKLTSDTNMKKYLDTVATKFISAKTMNYKDKTIEVRIKMKLAEHGMGLEFDSKVEGGSVTLYRYEPSIGLKMSKIEAYRADIEQVVGMSGIRILAPIPNSDLVGFEIPNETRTFPAIPINRASFEIAIGETVDGKEKRFDIRNAPHMLVAGSTGSGKSVFLNSVIKQLLTVPNVEFHLFDPKQIELFQFDGHPKVKEYAHNPNTISNSLENLVEEMEKRYSKMQKAKARHISEMKMTYKIIVIDEYADLAMRGGVEVNIQLLAQKGRACGIHLIIATQRASTKIINGDIKVNFPVKAVFKMSKGVDSRVMLDEDGAEKLLGKGDMLFLGENGVERLQGYQS